MKQYERRVDEHGQPYLETDLPGLMLTRLPLLNKGTAFTTEEREAFGLTGLFPSHVSSLDEQVERSYANFASFTTDLEKHVFLRVLQDRSEVLFYALVEQHLDEMMPIIYTPTVAQAVQQFSRIYRFPRGLVVGTDTIDRIDDLLANLAYPDVRLIVATDSEGILGIGDQGFGGLAICIGKLSLYTTAAGIDPAVTLPVELDVGTNRQDLLDDPLYLGMKHERLTGAAYDEFIDKFVAGVKRRFPDVLLQWEDFSKQKAFDVLNRYRDELSSFNDDIQGTGAVVLAGVLAAMRKCRQRLSEQVFLICGAGAGGIGVAEQLLLAMKREGLSEPEARARIFMVDSRGLVLADRQGLEPYKRSFAQAPAVTGGWSVRAAVPSLLETIEQAKVTTLIGLSGQRGSFDEAVVRAVDANTPCPIVFALSNPTSNCEVNPADAYEWTQGRAVVATGSPFSDVIYASTRYHVGQGNNVFIFPGLGLGVLLSAATKVTGGMLTAAAEALADYTDPVRLAQGGVYPRIDQLQSASRQVALAVIEQAVAEGVAPEPASAEDWEARLDREMWRAEYLPIRPPAHQAARDGDDGR